MSRGSRARYSQLPVAFKLMAPPLALFISLWAASTLGLGWLARHNLTQAASKETQDLANLLQQDLEQKQKLLSLKTRWLSGNQGVVNAVSSGVGGAPPSENRSQLMQTLLPMQAALELDLIRVVTPEGETLLASQQGALSGVQLHDEPIQSAAATGLDLSGVLVAKSQASQPTASSVASASSALISLISIKSSRQQLGTLILGIAVDDALLQQIRGNTSIHLLAFQGDRITASTLPVDRQQPWQLPSPQALPTRVTLGKDTYLLKTVEMRGFDRQVIHIAVLKPIRETEQAEQRLWYGVGGFGILGSIVVAGVTFLGLRSSQTLSRRIQKLTQATQALAQGDLSVSLPIETQDEVGQLAQGFNRMAEQLIDRDQLLQTQMLQLKTTLADLHRTQMQMVQSEKMSALGQMVAGVAHEINNPINFIYANLSHVEGYTQDLLRLVQAYETHYPTPPVSLQEVLQEVDLDFLSQDLGKLTGSMALGSERIRQIVLSLRNFARLDESDHKAVDLHEGLDNTLLILQHKLQAKLTTTGMTRPAIEVIKSYDLQLPLVECYAGQLNQALMNILLNAIDALDVEASGDRSAADASLQVQDTSSTVAKRSRASESEPGKIWISTCRSGENCVQVAIANNGANIPIEVRSRIFDPFFTTKPVGSGTGLGLSICYQIITEHHQGKLWSAPLEPQGVTFVIEIPIRQSS